MIAQLADPLHDPCSNRRYSRGTNSFILVETPSPLSVSFRKCSTPTELEGRRLSNEELEKKSGSSTPCTRLEALKTSFGELRFEPLLCSLTYCSNVVHSFVWICAEHSPHRLRGSPNTVEKKTPLQVRLKSREHRIFEFFLTERNYLSVLEYLTQTAFSVSKGKE